MAPLPYTVFALGEAQLHQIHTTLGKLFVAGEVALELFQETPAALGHELRTGKYFKQHSKERELLATALELGLPVDHSAAAGVTLLPSDTVVELLMNKRRHDLVQPFKLGLLKLSSQETARLLASGQYELALPVAQDAVKQGEALFKPAPALQMFPLYLLAAQANLGLRRGKQCEDLLGMACWLSNKMPEQTTNVMTSQLNRLYGQLYALQGRHEKALEAFASDVFCCSQEYGPLDARTSLGFYNLGKVFQAQAELGRAHSNFAVCVRIWLNALMQVVLAMPPVESSAALAKDDAGRPKLPLGTLQLIEVIEMLSDIASECREAHADTAASAMLAVALAWAHIGELDRAKEMHADVVSSTCKTPLFRGVLERAGPVLGVV